LASVSAQLARRPFAGCWVRMSYTHAMHLRQAP